MTTYNLGTIKTKSVGELPAIAATDVDTASDRIVMWDASATPGNRTKAISVGQLITLASNLSGQYERIFTQVDLSIAGILPILHGLNTKPSAIAVYNPAGQKVRPDDVDIVNGNAIAINLESYMPLEGDWFISIGA